MLEHIDHRSLADRRADATRQAIIEAAWFLSRRDGLMGWSLRSVAKEVGLKAPTLYAYFENKHAIYDAMFQQGYEELDALMAVVEFDPAAPRRSFKGAMAVWFRFCTSDPTRYHLMFQRVIPDFVPSESAYGASVAGYRRFRSQLASIGVTDDAMLDLWTAISTGLTDQQISNDPGGDRWERLLDVAVDLFCNHAGVVHDPSSSPSRSPA